MDTKLVFPKGYGVGSRLNCHQKIYLHVLGKNYFTLLLPAICGVVKYLKENEMLESAQKIVLYTMRSFLLEIPNNLFCLFQVFFFNKLV